MDLPQELIGEILCHLPSGDGQSLRAFSNYSLVSKSWLDPSRRILFADLAIGLDTYDRFLNTISSTNTGLLRHVRSLSYLAAGNEDRRPHRPIDVLQDHLLSLCRLRSLSLLHMQLEPTIPGRLDLFSAFQHTLSSLRLTSVSITWAGFASLVGYFPNLRSLAISWTLFQVDHQPVPYPSRALRGELSLWVDRTHSHDVDILANRFPELKPEYEDVVLSGTFDNQSLLFPIFQKTLKHLSTHRYESTLLRRCPSYHVHCSITDRTFGRSSKTLDLSLCPELQEVHICSIYPQQQDVASISSITSTNLRKIVLNFLPTAPWQNITWDPLVGVQWSHFDDMLCALTDRLRLSGHQHILEVEFRMEPMDLETGVDSPEFLPRFREKGRVRVSQVYRGASVSRADMNWAPKDPYFH